MDRYHCARGIVQTLKDQGYEALFAGGWVRDYLLSLPSQDIDIATSATPQEIQKIFPHTIPVGISFGVILVKMGKEVFEVSTFREDLDYQDGRHPEAVVFSSAKEDAKRRDFTINGLFFDPIQEEILDFVGGRKDLKKKCLRAIGDPSERFTEDKLRLLRAIRFTTCYDLEIEEKTHAAILSLAKDLFPSVAKERAWQELDKLAKAGLFAKACNTLWDYKLLHELFPSLKEISQKEWKARHSLLMNLPSTLPTVLYFPALLSMKDPSLLEKSADTYKLSKKERNLLVDLSTLWSACKGGKQDLVLWVKLYAHPHHELLFSLLKLLPPFKDKKDFFKEHQKRKIDLEIFINRQKNKKPVLSASDLLKEGIPEGKLLGELLRKAERLAIESSLEDKRQLLALLKKEAAWPHP